MNKAYREEKRQQTFIWHDTKRPEATVSLRFYETIILKPLTGKTQYRIRDGGNYPYSNIICILNDQTVMTTWTRLTRWEKTLVIIERQNGWPSLRNDKSHCHSTVNRKGQKVFITILTRTKWTKKHVMAISTQVSKNKFIESKKI